MDFGLYNTIEEIFTAIASLKTAKDKGDAFEHFSKLFFLHDERNADVSAVWLLDETPPDILDLLDMPSKDKGVDIIAQTRSGKFWLIQAKFRSDPCAKLRWGDELATFEALGLRTKLKRDLVSRLILITNTYEVPVHYREDAIFSAICHEDLINSQFIMPALRGEVPVIKEPRPYQSLDIAQSLMYYANNDRGKLIYPCGAGKTLTSIWITASENVIKTYHEAYR